MRKSSSSTKLEFLALVALIFVFLPCQATLFSCRGLISSEPTISPDVPASREVTARKSKPLVRRRARKYQGSELRDFEIFSTRRLSRCNEARVIETSLKNDRAPKDGSKELNSGRSGLLAVVPSWVLTKVPLKLSEKSVSNKISDPWETRSSDADGPEASSPQQRQSQQLRPHVPLKHPLHPQTQPNLLRRSFGLLLRPRTSYSVAEPNAVTRNEKQHQEGQGQHQQHTERSLGTAKDSRGGGAVGAVSLTFSEAMLAGALSRSIAQTCMQPMNVVKTLLQGRGTSSQLSHLSFKLLTRGAGAQFIMSLPHGALNFATLEVILGCSTRVVPAALRETAGPLFDFLSSSAATLVCSVVSTPQMVITDRIMAGMYPDLFHACREITGTNGVRGFYTGWSANVAQKIPSYGLTWVFFQQFKRLHRKATNRAPSNTENFGLGAAAAGATVCIMIPLDTVKTRLVTQAVQSGVVPYRGVLPTLFRIAREEGLSPLYRSLIPRLASVVPMIGIQFGMYEFVRKEIMSRKKSSKPLGLA